MQVDKEEYIHSKLTLNKNRLEHFKLFHCKIQGTITSVSNINLRSCGY